MNIDKSKLFFTYKEYDRKNFDSFSKDKQDLLSFYAKKHNEIPNNLKECNTGLLLSLLEETKDATLILKIIDKPFELFIISLVWFMEKNYENSITGFQYSIEKLLNIENDENKINISYLMLTLSTVYQQQQRYSKAIYNLKKLVQFFNNNKGLELNASNLLASCYFRIGVILLNGYKNKKLANNFIFHSMLLRYKYPVYTEDVLKNYLSNSYRFYAFTLDNKYLKYDFLNSSMKLKNALIVKQSDLFLAVETLFLQFDIVNHSINNGYKFSFAIRKINVVYKMLISLPKSILEANAEQFINNALPIAGFFLQNGCFQHARKWHRIINYLNNLRGCNDNLSNRVLILEKYINIQQ